MTSRPFVARSRAHLLRALVGDLSFAVVSNNCWGAHIYQALDLPYQTPFVGLFVLPDDYLRLLRSFDALMAVDLGFVPESSDTRINDWRRRSGLTYPIGMLAGHLELHFQHYASEAEAGEVWRRRVCRMPADPNRRFFKFDDRDGSDARRIAEFQALPLHNKVCFSARAYEDSVVVPADPGASHVPDGLKLSKTSHEYFNALRWISTLPRCVPLPSWI